MAAQKYRFTAINAKHWHTEPVVTKGYDQDGTEKTMTTFQSRLLETGDVVEMDEERFKTANLADRFELVEDEGKKKSAKDTDEPAAQATNKPAASETVSRPETEWTAVLSQGVMDVRAAVAALDNPNDLKALQKEEEKGSNRKMVLDAIEKRLGELKK